MTRATVRLALTVLLITVSSVVSGQSGASLRPPAALDAYIEKARVDWQVPGIAIAIVRGDSVIAAAGYGVRELGKPALVDEHTLFDVASLTKSFTAAAAGTLVDAGRMRWDDPVRKYLPTLKFPDPFLDREVTIRDLLSHRVGLNPPSNWMFRLIGEEGSAASLKRVPFLKQQAPFRTTLVYSNLGYVIAGEAMAAAGGMSWADLVRTRLIEPLGMRESFVNGDLPSTGNVARPHAVIGGTQRPIRSGSGEQGGPAGGVRSTAADMARWLRFQLGNGEFEGKRLVSVRAMEEAHSPQIIIPTTEAMRRGRLVEFFPGYGFGWQVMDYRGHRMLWHSGSADGFLAYMMVLPEEKLGVVVLVNSWIALNVHSAIVSRIADTYLGVEPRDWSGEQLRARGDTPAPAADPMNRIATPARALTAYAGRYDNPLYGPIQLAMDHGGLTLRLATGPVADVHQYAGDTLHVQWRDELFGEMFSTMITFTVGARGSVTGLRMVLVRDTVSAVRAAQRTSAPKPPPRQSPRR